MNEPGSTAKRYRVVQLLRRPRLLIPLTAIALFLVWRLGWLGATLDFVRGDWPQAQARIYVEPPQVYTRERLVNDRFREINWLEQRLRTLESVAERGPSLVTDTQVETQVGVAANGAQAAPPSAPNGSASQSQSRSPTLDQLDAFNLDFERRLAVRSEMLNTLLDDGHDLAGATLYRMNFDVSVIPRPGARGFGLIAIDVESNGCGPSTQLPGGCFSLSPQARLAQRVRAYRRLLASWEQDLQGFLSKVYQDRTDFPPETLLDPFGGAPKERIAFNWYVKAMAVEYWLGLVAGSDCALSEAKADAENSETNTCVQACINSPDIWACNAIVRRDQVRSALALPGSATLLPGDLSANLQRAFANEVKRYGGQVREKFQRRALTDFRGAFQTALDACPMPSPVPSPNQSQAGPPPLDQSGPDQPQPGRSPSGCGPQRGTDAATIAPQPSPFEAMHLAGLRLLATDRDCIDNPDRCPQTQLDELYARIQSSPACRSARPTLPWDRRHQHDIPCPPQWAEQSINLYGMVRLASQMRDLHNLFVKPASASTRGGVLPLLPEGLDDAGVAQRSRGLYSCLLPAPAADPVQEPAEAPIASATAPAPPACMPWLQSGDLFRERFLQQVQAIHPGTVDEVKEFKSWFAAFFVDRLRRSDIPGFQPSPPIDRFFSIGEVGCDTGACNVMVDRRRWLGEEDWEEIGTRLQARLRPFWAGDLERDPEREQAELNAWLQALLPSTHQLCRGDYRNRCLDILRSSLAVAKDFEVERTTLPPADFRSNADAFRARVTYDYRCNARDFEDMLEPDDDIAAVCTKPLSNLEQRVSWDFAQTVTALALEQRLDAIDGEVAIYTVEPRIKSLVDQTAVKQTLRLQAALDALPEAAGNARLDAARNVAERLERIGARATVVGFGYLRGSGSDAGQADAQRRASFGWLFLPNEFAPGGLLGQGHATHRPATHRLSAVLSVPSWWTGMRLTIRQCWGQFGLIDRAVTRDPYRTEAQCDGTEPHAGLAPAGRVVFPIELPASTERITEVFDFEVIKVPYITHRPPQEVARVEAGRRGRVVIQGGRLWRGTMVTLDDQQADQITVLPDMKGVVAIFDCVLPPAGQRHFTSNAKVESPRGDPADGPSNARLTVWTAQGNDSTQTRVWPFKQRIPGELPCWLEQAPTATRAPTPGLPPSPSGGDSKPSSATSGPPSQQTPPTGLIPG